MCQCCQAKAKYTINGYGDVCGRHLTYVVDMVCALGSYASVSKIL